MISKTLYDHYFASLIAGDRGACSKIVQDLLDQGIDIKYLYSHLFQASLYQVGALWEVNKLSVAREHLATVLTESLLNLVYPFLFKKRLTSKKAIISCTANEHHQIGGKMVADILEMNGWDSYFLGANTPIDELQKLIHEIKPDLVGLSLSIGFNFPNLIKGVRSIRENFPQLDIIVGGQGFNGENPASLKEFKNVYYISSLDELEAETWSRANEYREEKHPA